jgi:hypothetical protein
LLVSWYEAEAETRVKLFSPALVIWMNMGLGSPLVTTGGQRAHVSRDGHVDESV